jgi:hypothetical protein
MPQPLINNNSRKPPFVYSYLSYIDRCLATTTHIYPHPLDTKNNSSSTTTSARQKQQHLNINSSSNTVTFKKNLASFIS